MTFTFGGTPSAPGSIPAAPPAVAAANTTGLPAGGGGALAPAAAGPAAGFTFGAGFGGTSATSGTTQPGAPAAPGTSTHVGAAATSNTTTGLSTTPAVGLGGTTTVTTTTPTTNPLATTTTTGAVGFPTTTPPAGGAASNATATTNTTLAPTAATTTGTPGGAIVAAPTAAGSLTTQQQQQREPVTLEIPSYESLFPYRRIWNQVSSLVRTIDSEGEQQQPQQYHNNEQYHYRQASSTDAGQELIKILQCNNDPSQTTQHAGQQKNDDDSVGRWLLRPTILNYQAPNQQLRQQLTQHPVVLLHHGVNKDNINNNINSTSSTTTARLTMDMLRQVFTLADDLRIKEDEAICLYAQASQTHVRAALADQIVNPLLPSTSSSSSSSSSSSGTSPTRTSPHAPTSAAGQRRHLRDDIPRAAKELYFHERGLHLRTILLLLQYRIKKRDGGGPVLLATDVLLQHDLINNLIRFIQESTQRIATMMDEMIQIKHHPQHHHHHQGIHQGAPMSSLQLLEAHVEFTITERQNAAECLFFVCYHTQLLEGEIQNLVDLIRIMTNHQQGNHPSGGLKVLHPFEDVPDPYDRSSSLWTSVYNQQASAPVAEKDSFLWHDELVQTTWNGRQPHLLRCVSTLVVCAMGAMDTRNVLMDRYTHAPNVFETGNALLPPSLGGAGVGVGVGAGAGAGAGAGVAAVDGRGQQQQQRLASLNVRLSKDAIATWHRQDILGLIMLAYGMLLRSSPSAQSSPRAGGGGGGYSFNSPGVDIRRICRECMEAPVQLKSFTFARLCLLPALQMPATNSRSSPAADSQCDVSEFYLSVLSEFASHYLTVLSAMSDYPISRDRWENGANENLQLRRSFQEEQRRFQAWSNIRADNEEVIPLHVDPMERPDCLDDVIAFVTAVCSLGPEYALSFWSTEESVANDNDHGTTSELGATKLVPSRAVQDIERLQNEDRSLRGSYLSFLAALAIASDCGRDKRKTGAAAVHEMLLTTGSDLTMYTTWPAIFEILRWYIRELDPQDRSSASAAAAATATTGENTKYYYFDSGGTTDPTGNVGHDGSSVSSKPRELDEENTFLVLSHLALISNVASRCSIARCAILSVDLPGRGGTDGAQWIQDSTLMILFNLALMPLRPEERGAVFSTVASLLDVSDSTPQEASLIRNAAVKAWDLVEACQILPIHLLDQYTYGQGANQPDSPVLLFPPSSMALAGGKPDKSWAPVDPRYAIVYELEHVESALGIYPSTEGFLALLKSLFVTAGSPPNLGSSTRYRTGCSPYIEYVVHLVLPRATGRFRGVPKLPFRSFEDECRLRALGTEVAEAVLARYPIPDSIPDRHDVLRIESEMKLPPVSIVEIAKNALGHSSVANSVAITPLSVDSSVLADFPQPTTSEMDPRMNTLGASSGQPNSMAVRMTPGAAGRGVFPRPKSPGFTVLAELLASSESCFLDSIIGMLVDYTDSRCALVDRLVLTNALYLATPPTFAPVRDAARRGQIPRSLRRLIKPLRPSYDSPSSRQSIRWFERGILAALRVLCATVVREERFRRCLTAVGGTGSMRVIPVLRFSRPTVAPSSLKVLDVQPSILSELLVSSNVKTHVLRSIVGLVGHEGVVDIAAAAVGLVHYVDHALRPQERSIESYLGGVDNSSSILPRAFGNRLLLSYESRWSADHEQLMQLILDIILYDLRSKQLPATCMTQCLLGLPDERPGGRLELETLSTIDPQDCFEAILRLFHQDYFIFQDGGSTLATSCCEIVARVCTLSDTSANSIRWVRYSSEKLRSVNFWPRQLKAIVSILRDMKEGHRSQSLQSGELFHSVAWNLKGASAELQLLSGNQGISVPESIQQHSQYKVIHDILYNGPYALVEYVIDALPLERVHNNVAASRPSEESIRGAKQLLRGSPDVVRGYEVVDERKILQSMKKENIAFDEEKIVVWCEFWNFIASRDCASAHLSEAIYRVIGTSKLCDEVVGQFSPLATTPGSTMVFTILSRMRSVAPLDEEFFTTASRNLASSALLVTDMMLRRERDYDAVREASPGTCSLLAHIIERSEGKGQAGVHVGRQVERTAILANALSAFLMSDAISAGLTEISSHGLYGAAVVLARIACGRSDSQIPHVPSPYARAARSCLLLLLGHHGNDTDESPFLCAVLCEKSGWDASRTIVDSLISLVPLFDADITTLLESVAFLRGGSDFLLNFGILRALQNAAATYLREEERVMGRATPHQQHDIATPPFLLAHVRLMSALLASDSKIERRRNTAQSILATLCRYRPVVDRLISRFPFDGEVLRATIRCLAQVRIRLGYPSGSSDTSSTVLAQGLPADEHSALGDMERGIALLAVHLADNPLPEDFLRASPSRPSVPRHHNSSVVFASSKPRKSWWEDVDIPVQQAAQGWCTTILLTDSICSVGACGAELLLAALRLIRDADAAWHFDGQTLAYGLIRTIDAVKISTKVHLSQNQGGTYSVGEDVLKNCLSKLTDAVVELLLLIVKRLDIVHEGRSNQDVDQFRKEIAFALDHTKLDSVSFGMAQTSEKDENTLAILTELGRSLRQRL